MSTSKTPNYQLHSWLPSDDFRLHEINENFAALDAALHSETTGLDSRKTQVIVGAYQGTGHSLRIELGRKVMAVQVERIDGRRDPNSTYGGLMVPGKSLDGTMTVDDAGFTLTNSDYLNSPYEKYVFAAYTV